MERRTLMGLLDDVQVGARACEQDAEALRQAGGERHDLVQDGRSPESGPAGWRYPPRAEGGTFVRHEVDVHAALDLLRAAIDRLQGLVAELPRLDLPARPDFDEPAVERRATA